MESALNYGMRIESLAQIIVYGGFLLGFKSRIRHRTPSIRKIKLVPYHERIQIRLKIQVELEGHLFHLNIESVLDIE